MGKLASFVFKGYRLFLGGRSKVEPDYGPLMCASTRIWEQLDKAEWASAVMGGEMLSLYGRVTSVGIHFGHAPWKG